MRIETADTIARLQRLLRETLEPLIPRGAEVALLDFPNHNNSGDSAIWLGELRYLQEQGARIRYVCDAAAYDPADLDRALSSRGTILLHGGGNFGDLWPLHHSFRLRVIDDFPNRQIVQLPQTIRIAEEASTWMPLVGAAGNLTILVRDLASLALARTIPRADVRLAPDMALLLGELDRSQKPDREVVWIARRDHESRHVVPDHLDASDILVTDWLAADGLHRAVRSTTVRARGLIAAAARSSQGHQALAVLRRTAVAPHQLLARRRVANAVELLSRGHAVVTDRLHGHILCLLLGIPHVLLEDRGAKIRGFVDAFATAVPGVEFAASPEDALSMARDLAAA